MEDIKQKVSYLKGLMEGMDIKKDSKDGKIFGAIVSILEEMADEIYELQDIQEEMGEYLDSMDEDLTDLEDDFYEEGGCCGHDHDDDDDDEDEDFDPDEDYVEVVCPDCGDTVCFEAGILEDEDLIEVTCPNCDSVVFINDEEVDVKDAEKDEEDL